MAKRQFLVLYREFLFRMVDLEILSPHALGDMSKLLGQFAALLIFISLGLSFAGLSFAGGDIAPAARLIVTLITEQFLISTTMLVVGLFAVLSWESTFPERRDVLVLAPLPVRPRTMFLAKVAAVATALTLTVVLLHSAAGVVWPIAFAVQATPQAAPALTFDPTPVEVTAADLQSVLNRDLNQALSSGGLAPGTGAGLAIGVVKKGETRVFSYGTARTNSVFEIGSISKTFTGLMLAQMVEQKAVKFDEPIRDLMPQGMVKKPEGKEITLADLATQHSGLPRMPNNMSVSDPANPYADYGRDDLYAFVTQHGVAKPDDASFGYSNLGFGLLGQSLADRAGMSYSELLAKEVTGPLGMTDTAISLSPEMQSRFIQGYNAKHRPVPAWDLNAMVGAGGIRSTAGDMVKYLGANLHPEHFGSLRPALMESQRVRADADSSMQVALAWLYRADKGTYWHNGGTGGFSSYAFFDPGRDFAAVVLLNSGPNFINSPDLIGEHIRQRLAGEPAISLDTVFVKAGDGFSGLARWFGAYWFTMLAAGAFIYCCVLGVQGLAAQLFPRRIFLRVSGFLQLAAFCLFVSVYFLQPVFGEMETLIAPETQRLLRWLPPYWFLGLFHQLNGSMHPAFAGLARRAWMGLAIALCGTAVAYGLSYMRTLRRIVEEPDITPGSWSFGWLPHFGSQPQTAIVQFSVRSLLRSRQHRVLLFFYLGMGMAITLFLLKAPAMKPPLPNTSASDPWHEANTPLLAASIVMMALSIMGTRVVFARPLDLRANWIFKIVALSGGAKTFAASRRALIFISAAPVWLVSAALCFWLWPWQQAAGHLLLLGLIGSIIVDICLHGFRKIPFSCSYLPGKSHIHMVALGAFALLYLTLLSVKFERLMLQDARSITLKVLPFAVVALFVRVGSALASRGEEGLEFEGVAPPAVMSLGLSRDGVMTGGLSAADDSSL